ncbi:hypothetical protein GLAREA_00957 [Glarea lozoyensis ATCC 20868]|uniref:Uncharacterized protein n=1 Tax=Glarea lozoyensis (strain ATCC 20868 / MF5171) TaxID=1116229 RepID=S3CTV3_GLAL2|nr:uncharacterized protein GLAREA_00957 [Glarea lozoyensis ATCC 20868]EPE29797.1 hypothetical protein GLAREA_00957 [Glarea lozoyensis ATCC 20868]
METSSELSSSTPNKKSSLADTNTPGTSSVDSSILRFPAPATDERVSTWVESTAATRMSAHSEDGSTLGDSSYDFVEEIDTDREDNATESVASTDFGRPDDVASLADTEQSGDESDEEEQEQTPAQPFPDFEHTVQQAFDTPTLGRSSTVIIEDEERRLSQSIEFEEPLSLGAGNVSVKHTVMEFTEEETARLNESGDYQGSPKRLIVTIRQTMTKQCLSTKEPLRILYVGSHSAKQDIIHKIASTVTASAGSDKRSRQSRQWSSQLYNVVPVSDFGSERTPEIELMHSSAYQIKVEDCLHVRRFAKEASPKQPDILKLTTEDGSYHSVSDGNGFIVEPHWDLPHIAVFYYSDNDDNEAIETRKNATEFVERHAIPAILISHTALFGRDGFVELGQHSVHMCLESRDTNGRMNIIHQRLPIDLASFLNIDARQMNRHLAFLTGLFDAPEELREAQLGTYKKAENSPIRDANEKSHSSIKDSARALRNNVAANWGSLLPAGLLIISVLSTILTSLPGFLSSSQPTISINSVIVSDIPMVCTSTSVSSVLAPSVTPPSSVAVSTSTRTVTVTHAHSAGPNSLSVVPSMEIGKAAPKFNATPKSNKSVCSAELLGDREVLIRIPSSTKLSWLTKEAISVNISRGSDSIDTERVYSSDEGIVLSLPKKEAFGVLKIAVITTRKPRVNETFEIDFGTSAFQAWQSVMDRMSSIFSDDLSFSEIRAATDRAVKNAQAHTQATLQHVEEARKIAKEQTEAATGGLAELAKSMSFEAAKRSAILSKEVGIQIAEVEAKLSEKMKELAKLQEPVNDGILKAQVRSKLLWLKMQGKTEEHSQYEKKSTEAIRAKQQAEQKKRGVRGATDKKALKEKRKLDREAKRAAKKDAGAAKKSSRRKSTAKFGF